MFSLFSIFVVFLKNMNFNDVHTYSVRDLRPAQLNQVCITEYSSPPQFHYPQLSYFHSNAILNWVQPN